MYVLQFQCICNRKHAKRMCGFNNTPKNTHTQPYRVDKNHQNRKTALTHIAEQISALNSTRSIHRDRVRATEYATRGRTEAPMIAGGLAVSMYSSVFYDMIGCAARVSYTQMRCDLNSERA